MTKRSFAPVAAPLVFGLAVLAAGGLLSRETPRGAKPKPVAAREPVTEHARPEVAARTASPRAEPPRPPAELTPHAPGTRVVAQREEASLVVAMELRRDAEDAARSDPSAVAGSRTVAEGEVTPEDFAAK